MLEVALYLVSGLTLYAGGHHLYLGGDRTRQYPHVQLGALYLLLSGFALASAMTFQSATLNTLLPTGKVAISLGLILWCALVWHIALRCNYRPWLFLDLITAVWAVLLLQNITSPNSLIYAQVMPVRQTLLNGETLNIVHTLVSPWWLAAEIAMLVSLVFCAYATYRFHQRRHTTQAYFVAAGLAVLALVALHDHLVSTQTIHSRFIAPFGFLGFLLSSSLYPVIKGWRSMRKPKQPPMIYNLSFNPECASFHTDVSQIRTPLCDEESEAKDKTPQAGTRASPAKPFPVAADEDIHDVPAETLHVVETGTAEKPAKRKIASKPRPVVDEALLHKVTDNLIDIAVYATMALNRFKRGDADAETLETLCKKVRTRAIKTRRMANRLAATKQLGYDGEDKDKDSRD